MRNLKVLWDLAVFVNSYICQLSRVCGVARCFSTRKISFTSSPKIILITCSDITIKNNLLTTAILWQSLFQTGMAEGIYLKGTCLSYLSKRAAETRKINTILTSFMNVYTRWHSLAKLGISNKRPKLMTAE